MVYLGLILVTKIKYGATTPLGTLNDLQLSVTPLYDIPALGEGCPYATLIFVAKKDNKQVTRLELPVGMTTKTPPYQYQIRRFMGKSTKQIFISTYCQGITTFLLDFDGKSIRKVYADNRDRVWTKPMWDKKHRFYVDELVKIDSHYEDGKHVDSYQVHNRIYFTKNWTPIPGPEGGPEYEKR